MQSDAEVFGLGNKKRKLKQGETGAEFDDYTYEDDTTASPNGAPNANVPQTAYEAPESPEKSPLGMDGNDTRQSQTKPIGSPQSIPTNQANDILNTDGTPRTGLPIAPKSTSVTSVGHNGTTSQGLNREQYGAAWGPGSVKTMDDLRKFVAQYGGEIISDNGTVLTPYGEQIDMLENARGSAAGSGVSRAAWGGVGGSAGASGADPLAQLVASQGASGASPSATGAPSTGGAGTLEEMLARQLSGGIDADPAVSAFKRSATRDADRERARLAEQSALDGTNDSGGLDGRLRQLKENTSESIAGFAGNRAADVQRLAVQQDQFLKSLGFNYAQLDQQQKQWLGNLNQNRDQFLASLGLSERQLNAQQKNALDQLGLAYDQLEVQQNRDSTLAALGAY